MGIFPFDTQDSTTPGIFERKDSLEMLDCFLYDFLFCGNVPSAKKFKEVLKYHHILNHNVIYSFENWSNIPSKDLAKHNMLLFKEFLVDWDVKILITYRRAHDWIPSLHNQLFKEEFFIDGTAGSNWPGEGGGVIPSLPDAFNQAMSAFTYEKFSNYFDNAINPLRSIDRWSTFFSDVKVLNIHDGSPTKAFVCDILPNASKACNNVLVQNEVGNGVKSNKTKNEYAMNASMELYYDMLSVAAMKRGWIKRKLSRRDVRDAVYCRLNTLEKTSKKNHPLKCLSYEQLESLWMLSLSYEKRMLLEKHNEDELRKSFDDAVKKKKFCSVDVEVMLDTSENLWQQFFSSLQPIDNQGHLNASLITCDGVHPEEIIL